MTLFLLERSRYLTLNAFLLIRTLDPARYLVGLIKVKILINLSLLSYHIYEQRKAIRSGCRQVSYVTLQAQHAFWVHSMLPGGERTSIHVQAGVLSSCPI
jgi:hypothetical protein